MPKTDIIHYGISFANIFNPPNDLKEAGSDWKKKKGSVVRNPYILNFWRSFLSSIKSMK